MMVFGFLIGSVCFLYALTKLAEAHSGVSRIFRELESERQSEESQGAGAAI